MMSKKKHTSAKAKHALAVRKQHIKLAGITICSICIAFVMGIGTSGSVQTVGMLGATSMQVEESVTLQPTLKDIIEMLEVADGQRSATVHLMRLDPTPYNPISVADATELLRGIAIK